LLIVGTAMSQNEDQDRKADLTKHLLYFGKSIGAPWMGFSPER
jgi:hypothetical protein